MKNFPSYPVEIIEKKITEDFSEYESVPPLTEEDILSEEKRAMLIKSENKQDDPMMRRKALEADLSAMLLRKKFTKGDMRKLGYLINDARVKARVYNYIHKYLNKDDRPN
jgi:hypothetical protein